MTKEETLAKFLEIEDIEEIEETKWESFEAEGNEYLVLTDDEADRRTADYIKESVWAFNPSFLVGYLPEGVDEDVIKILQEKYEGANEAIYNMIDDIDQFVEDAICADGRGHFLSTWNGHEHEQGEYFIYRV